MKHSYIDKYNNIDSIIQRLDPRVKIITFVAFILFVMFTPPINFFAFTLYGLLIFILIKLSKIPICFILKRSLVIIPFVLMIAIFIPFFKEGKVAGGYSFGTIRLTVTYNGLLIFWNVLVKAYLSILCMILLAASTRFSNLLNALEGMRFPKLIIMVLSFMYRYMYVLVDELMRMKRAKDSRPSSPSKKWHNLKALANMTALLFIRGYERGERVYFAMCSRGFDGKMRTLQKFRLGKIDLYFLLSVTTLLIAIRFIRI